MERLSPFLVGGPAFSGSTLLALLVNRPGLVCLDEPDFEKPAQSQRGIPLLRRLFPTAPLPPAPTRALSFEEAFDVAVACDAALRPAVFGFKTCGTDFLSFAPLFRRAGLPVIVIVRDIRDALVRPLPPWTDEASLNASFRAVWAERHQASTWLRFEDLVARPEETMVRVAAALGQEATFATTWDATRVPAVMLKLDRHDLLRTGAISTTRVGIWRHSGVRLSEASLETAHLMGYDP